MSALIDTVNRLRAVHGPAMAAEVRSVCVILCSSRSGSSLMHSVLAGHPDIATLDGEIEPFLALTGNGFGYSSDSDALGTLVHRDELAANLLDEASVHADGSLPPAALRERWRKRCLLQFPALFTQPAAHRHLRQALDAALGDAQDGVPGDEAALQAAVLERLYRESPWRIGCYDGQGEAVGECRFDELEKIEEPPFVLPRHFCTPLAEAGADGKVLLFKAPSDAYRIGIHRQLFPNADIRYIHLTRGYAQTVNGLMDGWLSPRGFFSHDMRRAGVSLRIRGYSDQTPFGERWWKFDLPPNWRDWVHARLDQVCLNQWMSAHHAILDSGLPCLRLAFEDFLDDPSATMRRLTDYLDLPPADVPDAMPVRMATERPRRQRWRKRERMMLDLGESAGVASMMDRLGYRMAPETWP
ncbi:sulfotransferase [Pseudoduganella namucuonensis]|uniref:Sulfotransferase family protein n=1 Tax=Pseudoduganella namucuonensis TaxID=1035707 RepID=A0A1I7KP72_9BURK|nr:sulfotransferase [Pseudoduganella namucuonensis]SFU99242.1 Sulfotransferase family protein [Pseudoduganella namucuonensis]